MTNFKVTLEKQELITKRAEFVVEAASSEELELCLEDMTYEDIEEEWLEKKLEWKTYYRDLQDTNFEIEEVK